MTARCDEDDCQQVYPFNETLIHRKMCKAKNIPCLNNCGDGRLYKGVEAMLEHVLGDCPKTKVICGRCKYKDLRERHDGHNCVIGFIK